MKQLQQDPFRWDQFKGVKHLPKERAERWKKIGFFTALAGFSRALLRMATNYAEKGERF